MATILLRLIQTTALIITCATLTGVIAGAAEPQAYADQSEFHFARMAFGAYGSRPSNNRREPWLRDWPEAEVHLIQGVSRLTRIDSGSDNRMVFLDDDSLFDHPVLYAVKVGYWHLSNYETQRLREFLLRGGFLIVDDFHGPSEWITFSESLRRVFPNRPIVEIPSDDEVFNVLYTLDQRVQIPGAQAIQYGVT
jgi:hypothetical protein